MMNEPGLLLLKSEAERDEERRDENGNGNGDTGLSRWEDRCTLRKSTSDDGLNISKGVHDTPHPGPSLDYPRQSLRRLSSTSEPHVRSYYHDQTVSSAALQEQLVQQTKRSGKSTSLPWRVRTAQDINGLFQATNPPLSRLAFERIPVRSKSDYGFGSVASAKESKKEKPLKSSLKRKSKSAATTPPRDATRDASSSIECQQLRRVKTVDFAATAPTILVPLPPLKPWSNESNKERAYGEYESTIRKDSASSYQKSQPAGSIHPCPASTCKSKAADCAVTRTDVHVVAIAPSCTPNIKGDVEPATPTMQVVESKDGRYEVIWNDAPAEDSDRLRRRDSSASQALHTVGSTAARGLELVNSKLTEWTWGHKGQPGPFMPQIVVFPDDDGRTISAEGAIRDDEGVRILAPPNSQRTSTNPSRLPSHPVSARASRSGSHDEEYRKTVFEESESSDDETSVNDNVAALPDRGASAPDLAETRGQIKQQLAFRRPSNMEESEVKFRGHRDSVALTRSRIIYAGGISPELFMHRDSVYMAKKRMKSRNHATSDAREISRPKGVATQSASSAEELSMSGSSTTKDLTNRALKSSSSASLLHLQPSPINRHIRIIE
jgi:hypothetical protein